MVATGMERNLAVKISGDSTHLLAALAAARTGLGRTVKAVGGLSLALGALGTVGLAAATKAAADFETAMVEVQKVTDPQIAAEMSKEVRDMVRTIPLAQNALAGLVADAARFGIRGRENLRDFSEAAAKMAIATDVSATEAGQAFAKLAQLTDTPIPEIENLGSAINSLSNSFATSSSEIVDSMLRSSAALAQLGLTQTEIAGLSAALNEVSESSRRAGTRLRRVAQEMMEPRKVEDLASALGMTVDEFKTMREESPVDLIRMMAVRMDEGGKAADALRSTLSTASRQAIAGLAQNLDGMNEALETSQTQFEENTSLQREFEAATDTFNTQLTLLKNNIRNAAIAVGNRLLPVFTPWLKRLNDIFPATEEINDSIDRFISRVDTVSNRIKAVLLPAFALVESIVGPIIDRLNALWAEHSEVAIEAATTVRDTVIQRFQSIRDRVPSIIDAVRARVEPRLSKLRTEVIEPALDKLKTVWQDHGGAIKSILPGSFDEVKSDAKTVLDTLKTEIVRPALAEMESLWGEHGPSIRQAAKDTFTKIEEHARTAAKGVKQLVDGGFKAGADTLVELYLDAREDIRIALVGEDGSSGPVITAIKGIGSWLTENAAGVITPGIEVVEEVLTRTLENARITLVGENGDGGILNTLIRQMESFLSENAGPIIQKAAESAWDVLKVAFEETKIALVGRDGSGGLIKTLITETGQFLESDSAKNLVREGWKALGKAWRAAVDETTNLILWNDDSIIKGMIKGIGAYLREDAWDDMKAGDKIFKNLWREAFAGFILGLTGLEESELTQFGQNIKEYFGTPARAWGTVKLGFKQFIDNWKQAWRDFVKDIIGNSIIPDMITDIKNFLEGEASTKLNQAMDQVASSMQTGLETFDPSSVSSDLQGIIDEAGDALSALNDIPSHVSTTITRTVETVTSGGGGGGASHSGPGPGGPGDDDESSINRNRRADVAAGERESVFAHPALHTGGFIERGGLAFLQAGEQVVPSAKVDRSKTSTRNVHIRDLIVQANNVDELLTELEAHL